MASRTDKPAQATRDRILKAATSVLARRGYHDTNVEEIVSRSGTSKGGFYFHFPSKERMVVGLVEQLANKLVSRVDRSIGSEPRPDRRLAIAVTALLHTLAGQRKLARVLLINVVGHGKALDKKFLPVRDKFAGLIQREMDNAVAKGTIEPIDTLLASRAWLGALHEVLFQWLMDDVSPPISTLTPTLGTLLFRSVGLPQERFAEAS
jgi:AcrR family transcriptional regulator